MLIKIESNFVQLFPQLDWRVKKEPPRFLRWVKVEGHGLQTRRGPHDTTSKSGGTPGAPPNWALWRGPLLVAVRSTLAAKVDSPTDALPTPARVCDRWV